MKTKEQKNEYERKYYSEHREQYRQYRQKEQNKEHCKIYYQTHQEQIKKYRNEHKEQRAKACKNWATNHREHLNEYRKKRYTEHRERLRKQAREQGAEYRKQYNYKNARLKRLYGLSWEKYEELLSQQDNKCVLCGVRLDPNGPKKTRPHVDHDHNTGKVRGILCLVCNSLVGFYENALANKDKIDAYLRQKEELVLEYGKQEQ